MGYGLALAAALLFQIMDVGYLAHFLFWAALALPVLSLLLTLPALAGCRGTLTAAAPAGERGTPVRFRSGVGCRGPLPPPRVVARLALGNALTGETARRRVVLTGLPDRAGALEAWTDWENPHCGRLTCRVERLRVVDGLGLFALPVPRPQARSVLSLPHRLDLPLPPALAGEEEAAGPLTPRPGGGPGEDYDLRPYRPGDPVSAIHWKLSSKRDELVVRETLGGEKARVVITVELFGDAEQLDRVLERLWTTSLALLAAQVPHQVLWTDGDVQEAQVTCRKELLACMERLLSRPAPAGPPPEMPELTHLSGVPRLHIAAGEEGAP